MSRWSLRVVFGLGLFVPVSGMSQAACAPAVEPSAAPMASAPRPSDSSMVVIVVPAATPATGPATTSAVASAPQPSGKPEWYVSHTDAEGKFTLRCENTAKHPTTVADGCACGETVLNPCGSMASHDTDRRQCFFQCNAQRPFTFALRCPDGAKAEASAAGCVCGNGAERVLNPCDGAPATVDMRGDACVVRCRAK